MTGCKTGAERSTISAAALAKRCIPIPIRITMPNPFPPHKYSHAYVPHLFAAVSIAHSRVLCACIG